MHAKYILGMAKSNLYESKAGSKRSLELDFLRLVYFLKTQDNVSICYLQVLEKDMLKLINEWKLKYDTTVINDKLIINYCVEKLDDIKDVKIRSEISNNKLGKAGEATEREKYVQDELIKRITENKSKVLTKEEIPTHLKKIKWDAIYEIDNTI